MRPHHQQVKTLRLNFRRVERLMWNVLLRTYHYKKMSILALIAESIIYLLIAWRWFAEVNQWEALYTFPLGFAFGIVLSSQFIAMSVSVPKTHLGTAVSIYFLSQQVGIIAGTGISTGVVQVLLRHNLMRQLKDYPDRNSVSGSWSSCQPLLRIVVLIPNFFGHKLSRVFSATPDIPCPFRR